MLDGARQLAEGKRPSLHDLLMTPANAIKVAHQLAHLRGAAMKVGQLLSMDAGEILPSEVADIFGSLRSEAQHMPQNQLRAALDRQWGQDWQQRFELFSFQPVAAASIGQVHRARTRDGCELAIKVQYPGIRQSIDSDVDNVSSLLRMSGLLPKNLDISSLLREAKRQLREEADYEREGGNLKRFAQLLSGSADYIVPNLCPEFTRPSVLAMTYIEGVGLESLTAAPQDERDRIVSSLIDLVLRELFEFKLMQTDPNFANYRYDAATQRIILLDFGAVREFSPALTESYRTLLKAGLDSDRTAAGRAALELGLLASYTPRARQDAVMTLVDMAMQPLRYDGRYDFGTTDIVARLRYDGMAIAADRDHWHIPPIDTLFLQRKVGGIFLLASRLKARVRIRPILNKYL